MATETNSSFTVALHYRPERVNDDTVDDLVEQLVADATFLNVVPMVEHGHTIRLLGNVDTSSDIDAIAAAVAAVDRCAASRDLGPRITIECLPTDEFDRQLNDA